MRRSIERLKAKGRFGDDQLAHLSSDEIALLSALQGGVSINPDTGLPEFFSFKKVLKGIAKAAGGIVGAYIGGPAGAALGTGITSAVLGDSMGKSLTNGLMAGLGSYGLQKTGIGDSLGISSLSSGADLLGRGAGEMTIQTASGSGGGGGISSLLPMLGLGAVAAAAGSAGKQPKMPDAKPDTSKVPDYEKLDRDTVQYEGDPYGYGQFTPQFSFFDDIHPDLQPLAMRYGGKVRGYKYGGNVSEGGKKQGDKDRGGQGPNAGGNRGGSDSRGEAIADRRASQANANAAAAARASGGGAGNAMPDPRAEAIAQNRLSKNMGKAIEDYDNLDQGLTDDPLGYIGRVVGGIFGVGEIDPRTQKMDSFQKRTNASWGLDPIGALLGVGGLASGIPGPGAIWSGLKSLSGYNGPVIAFDGNQPVTDWSPGSPMRDLLNGTGIGRMFDGTNGGGRTPGGGITANTGNFGAMGSRPKIGAGDDVRRGGPRPATPPAAAPAVDPATGRIYNPLTDPFTYGQFGPQHEFFTGQIPFEPIKMAHGGGVPGGMSDAVPAMLSVGEHVIDAETVSMLGDGSNDAGHAKIEQFKANLRKQKRKVPASQVAPEAKGMSAYMRAA